MKYFSQKLDSYKNYLCSFSHTIAYKKYMEDILKLIMTVTTSITDIKICSIWLIDGTENPNKIKLRASQGIEAKFVKNRSLGMNEGIVGLVVSSQKIVFVEDILKEPQFKEKEMAKKLGLVSMVGIPMKDKNNNTTGALSCFVTRHHEFSATEINMMTILAKQASNIIQNTEFMVKEKVIQEELVTIKKIENATDILMRHLNIGIDEAHKRIQKCSTKSLQSFRQVAEAILMSNSIQL